MTLQEYQDLLEELRWRIPEFRDEWARRLAQFDAMSGLSDLAFVLIGKFQRGDYRLRMMLGVPAHVLYALRKVLMRLRIGGGEDDHA